MARGDTLDAQIARCVAGKLENLGAQVLADSSHVHCRGGTHTAVTCNAVLQVPVDTAHRELCEWHKVKTQKKIEKGGKGGYALFAGGREGSWGK